MAAFEEVVMPKDQNRPLVVQSGPGKRCGRYIAGHEVHCIQARLSVEEPGVVEGGLVTRVAMGVITVRVDGVERDYWNHDTARLREVLKRHGKLVQIHERWGLLKVPNPTGFFCFCIATPKDPRVHCEGEVL